jgi:ABC-type amino acid transport substrate-binding protein
VEIRDRRGTLKRARIMIAALVALFALVVASCADEDGGDTGATGGTGTAPTGATATGPTGETGFPAFTTLQDGVLQAANCLDYPPFESVVDGDEVGFDIDLVEEIGSRLGLTVEWIRADFDTVFTAVAGNQFDMVAAAATIRPDREEVVDFSDPYYNSLQSLTVNTAETPDITSFEQLGAGDTVAVQKGTTGKIFAEENLAPEVELVTFQLNSDMFRELEGAGVTAVMTDAPAALEIVKDLPDLEVVQQIDTMEQYGFAFSPSNPELREAVNLALAQVIADGTYAEIFGRYFPPEGLPPEFEPTA